MHNYILLIVLAENFTPTVFPTYGKNVMCCYTLTIKIVCYKLIVMQMTSDPHVIWAQILHLVVSIDKAESSSTVEPVFYDH